MNRALELTLKPARRLLPGRPDRAVELLRGGVHETSSSTVEDALELLDLPPLDLAERALDPPRRVSLLTLDPAHEVALPGGHPVGDLMECPAPFGGVRLELGLGGRGRLGGGPRQVLPQPADRGPLLLVDSLQAVRVALETRLERLDQRALMLRDLLEPGAELPLRALEVLMPRGEPLLDLTLHLGERLSETVAQALLALTERLAPRLREAALLFGVGRKRVRPRARECPLEVCRSRSNLTLGDRGELRLRLLNFECDRPVAGNPAPQRQGRHGHERARDQPRPRDGQLGRRRKREGDPRSDGAQSDRCCSPN